MAIGGLKMLVTDGDGSLLVDSGEWLMDDG